jgi:hypothetical protein
VEYSAKESSAIEEARRQEARMVRIELGIDAILKHEESVDSHLALLNGRTARSEERLMSLEASHSAHLLNAAAEEIRLGEAERKLDNVATGLALAAAEEEGATAERVKLSEKMKPVIGIMEDLAKAGAGAGVAIGGPVLWKLVM